MFVCAGGGGDGEKEQHLFLCFDYCFWVFGLSKI